MGVEQREHMDTGRGTSHGLGARGRIPSGVIPNIDDILMGAANHHDTCISM